MPVPCLLNALPMYFSEFGSKKRDFQAVRGSVAHLYPNHWTKFRFGQRLDSDLHHDTFLFGLEALLKTQAKIRLYCDTDLCSPEVFLAEEQERGVEVEY